MNARALLCVPVGHRWAPVAGDSPSLTMRCERCGRTGIFSKETESTISIEQRMRPIDRYGNRLP